MTNLEFDHFYKECRAVESKYINHADEATLELWSCKQAFRVQRIATSLEPLIQHHTTDSPFVILNLSGLGSGSIDFPLARHLKQAGHDIQYFALDHPDSPFMEKEEFLLDTQNCGINLIRGDLKSETAESLLQHMNTGGKADYIVFTEIAEHLEHSVLLNSFQLISQVLSGHGRLLISTPNLASAVNRARLLIGADLDYWGDGIANMQRNVYGHIAYYNVNRLRRLLSDTGLDTIRANTFSYPWNKANPNLSAPPKRNISATIIRALINLGERLWRFPKTAMMLRTLGETIELEAKLGPVKPTPFEF